MPKVYIYKITADDGIAPCPQRGMLTLGVCKPAIRRTAREGDYLVGVGSNNRYQSKLIYVAQIGLPIPGQTYFSRNGPYWHRRDCIYQHIEGDEYLWLNRRRRGVHDPARMPSQHNRDVGSCRGRSNAVVLPSHRFVYFGQDQAGNSEAIWGVFPDVIARVLPLQQSHLVHHEEQFQGRVLEFCEYVLNQEWQNAPEVDQPHDEPNACTCHDNRQSVCD